ncbi:hypothetical protein C8C83_5468 [Flavobacterium sp. 90]|nr:hypothetical protein C8C82_0095 [Flavobacterium sp. 81]TCK57421.1 hypothetical protein C8C83_5468 [Flavobacterium sp. 90]
MVYKYLFNRKVRKVLLLLIELKNAEIAKLYVENFVKV